MTSTRAGLPPALAGLGPQVDLRGWPRDAVQWWHNLPAPVRCCQWRCHSSRKRSRRTQAGRRLADVAPLQHRRPGRASAQRLFRRVLERREAGHYARCAHRSRLGRAAWPVVQGRNRQRSPPAGGSNLAHRRNQSGRLFWKGWSGWRGARAACWRRPSAGAHLERGLRRQRRPGARVLQLNCCGAAGH